MKLWMVYIILSYVLLEGRSLSLHHCSQPVNTADDRYPSSNLGLTPGVHCTSIHPVNVYFSPVPDQLHTVTAKGHPRVALARRPWNLCRVPRKALLCRNTSSSNRFLRSSAWQASCGSVPWSYVSTHRTFNSLKEVNTCQLEQDLDIMSSG